MRARLGIFGDLWGPDEQEVFDGLRDSFQKMFCLLGIETTFEKSFWYPSWASVDLG